MKVKRVCIENFKCFKSVDIELGKLTLLTGANSSGKSSILYSILGPLQSGEFPFQFSPNGKYVSMGNFQEISYKHLRENIIKIGFNIVDESERHIKIFTYWEEDKLRKLPNLTKLQLETGRYNLEITKKRKYTLNYRFSLEKEFKGDVFDLNEAMLELFSLFRGMTIKVEGNGKDINDHDLERRFNKLKKVKKSVTFKFESFDELRKLSLYKGDLLLSSRIAFLSALCERLDNKINFISSFRLYPERTYYEKSKTDLTVGKFGEGYENQIISWETKNSKKYKELIKIMKDLSLLVDISSKRLDGGRFELLVKVNRDSVPASLNDVGFGISQFLPIVVADLQLGDGSTLFVAQPEIHLHPSVQAEFGNYMVNQIKESDKNYIIETHSEYLLNRIRLAIVKKEVTHQDVKVYYLQNDGEDTQTHQLEFTTDGQILNAPEDFFKTYMMDVMNIAVNANSNGE
ncbi:MAG: DUF3696 domain-containing protein [Candidatus Aminicenantes bacterium]|nr:MAG: DUF3696 domain-containing protein [Candidatus Aminicenantes bacterium]